MIFKKQLELYILHKKPNFYNYFMCVLGTNLTRGNMGEHTCNHYTHIN